MLSIIIPARNEQFLQRTIEDLLEKARGDIEIIAVLDGYWPIPQLKDDPRVHILHRGKPRGMRQGINDGIALAKGKYVMKIDAHCAVGIGFDVALTSECKENWLMIPRRYRLDPDTWNINKKKAAPIDHQYICFPDNPNDFGGPTLTGRDWRDRAREYKYTLIDELMTWQGSCWMMHKAYFEEIGGVDTELYGTFGKEPQELGLKVWLGRGKVVRNKRTWYAHLHKGRKFGRGYSLGKSMLTKGGKAINKWLRFGEAWEGQQRDLKWLIDRFAPVPGWEDHEWTDEWRNSL